jgi:transcriptional regulator with XRE-family HTH domain
VFGNAVRSARGQRGWTLEELGSRMGRPDGKYLGEVERGFHAPTITTAKEIADALDLRLADLLIDV